MGYDIYFARTLQIAKDANKTGRVNMEGFSVFKRDYWDWDSKIEGEPIAISFNYRPDLNKIFESEDWTKVLSNKTPIEVLNIIERSEVKDIDTLCLVDSIKDIKRFLCALKDGCRYLLEHNSANSYLVITK